MNETIVNARADEFEISETRRKFLNKTYYHLLAAIMLFVAIEVFLFKSGYAYPIANAFLGTSWLLVLGGFMVVSWMATHVAQSNMSKGMQYVALLGFVAAWALIFVPMFVMAMMIDPSIIESAALVTLVGFAVLTGIVMYTGQDFSFMRGLLMWIGACALIAIVASVLFGFELGTWFSVAMVAFSGAAILYDTSNILHHYPEDKYVSASLALFGSIAMMMWYVLRIFMSRD